MLIREEEVRTTSGKIGQRRILITPLQHREENMKIELDKFVKEKMANKANFADMID